MVQPQLPKSTATRQFAELVLAPVDPEQLATLRELLAQVRAETIAHMQGARLADALLPWHAMPGLHYARFVLLDEDQPGHTLLAFATDYDGPEGEDDCSRGRAHRLFLSQLIEQLGAGLEQIF